MILFLDRIEISSFSESVAREIHFQIKRFSKKSGKRILFSISSFVFRLNPGDPISYLKPGAPRQMTLENEGLGGMGNVRGPLRKSYFY